MDNNISEPAHIFTLQAAKVAERRVDFDLRKRKDALRSLKAAIHAREDDIVAAIGADFGKHSVEVRLTEILPVYQEINHTLRHLRRWMRTRRVMPGLSNLGSSARIKPTPKGTSLIIAPWNFPFLLAIAPLVSALGAGCSAVVKPSEMTPATSALIAKIIAEVFDPDLVTVAQGGADVSQALLAQPFDHVFFTGSPAVGKIVMAAAAKHLTSVTLELGGKSPVIVGPGADLTKAAKWIVWGRFINAGQTCIAPDHVFVHASQHDALVTALKVQITRMFGDDPLKSPALAQIINPKHWARIMGLIGDATSKGAQTETEGSDEATRKIAPTLLLNTTTDMDISDEEVFGPVLPVIAYDDLSQAIDRINAGPHPLALYVFGGRDVSQAVIAQTTSGTVGVNLTILPFSHANLPFGGIGNSGMGAGHGRYGFEAFSHMRPVMINRLLPLDAISPPYGKTLGKTAKILTNLIRRI